MRRGALLLGAIVLLSASAFSSDAPIHRKARSIPGRYLVVLASRPDTIAVANTVRNLNGGRVHHIYERGLNGLAVEMSDADAQALARDSRVRLVEEDAVVAVASTPWGLDRIDQRFLPLNGTYVSDGTGAGVNVYVVDTGIFAAHQDFGGRVRAGFSAFEDGAGTADCNGHGTHVAAVIGGSTHGVARSATLVPVRVLDCFGFGTVSSVLAGLDWVLLDHAQSPGPAVVNMSLSGDASSVLDMAVNDLLSAGITTVLAAGNGGGDACRMSPGRVAGAITVGASNEADERAAFSNYGSCVDLFAPGTNILSAWYSSPTATAVGSGTSKAAPFVSGVAALLLEKYPLASPATVSETVASKATLDMLAGVGDASPNRLVFSLIDSLDEAVGDAQLLSDPSFEFGTNFWTSDICTVVNPTGCPPSMDFAESFDSYFAASYSRSGTNHATIGGPARTFNLSSETVTIPSSVDKAELSFYLWIAIRNKKESADDVLAIEVRDASGALLETLGTFSNLDANDGYKRRRFDMTRYRGATIRIAFRGVQNPGPPTWFLLDDAALNIWK